MRKLSKADLNEACSWSVPGPVSKGPAVRWQVAYVDDCGHCAHLEKPAEAARLVLEFMGASAEADRAGSAPVGQALAA